MIVLGIESSSPTASVALVSAEKVWGEITLNVGLTHAEQLLPLIDDLLRQTRVKRADLAGIAVSGGPGSFTGLRIGMATAKGLAQGLGLPIISIPTLLAVAFPFCGRAGLVAPMLNARKNEIYTTLYKFSGNQYEELEPVQAVKPAQWAQKLAAYSEDILLSGDGVSAYEPLWREALGEKFSVLPPFLQMARGVSVAWLGEQGLRRGEADDLFTLKPQYIRSSAAERQLAGG